MLENDGGDLHVVSPIIHKHVRSEDTTVQSFIILIHALIHTRLTFSINIERAVC